MGHGVRTARARRSGLMKHMRRDRCGLGFRQMQAEFGAPPEHIIGRSRPFVTRKVVEFGLGEAAAEIAAKVRHMAGGSQDFLDASSIGARKAQRGRLVKERPALPHTPSESSKVCMLEIAAG